MVHKLSGEADRLRAIETSVSLARDGCLIGFTEPRRGFDERLQHGLQIEGRAADNFQHVGGCGLLLQRFGQVVGTLAQFPKQPRVFYRDDGLLGEILDQRDLLVGERPDLLAKDRNRADQFVLLQHWYDDDRPGTGDIDDRNHAV